jgi:hypothetical protein
MVLESESGFVCGEHHALPLSYSVKAPLAVGVIPAEELDQRVVITPDQCVVDGKDFYPRSHFGGCDWVGGAVCLGDLS